MKTEDGAGAFSLIKHTLLVLLGIFYFAWFADGEPWNAARLLAGRAGRLADHAGGRLRAAATALPPHARRSWLLPLVPLLRGLAWLARPCVALLGFFQSLVDLADDAAADGRAAHAGREHRGADFGRHRRGPHRGGGPQADSIGGRVRRQGGARSDDAAAQHRRHLRPMPRSKNCASW